MALAREARAAGVLRPGSSVLTLTYYGAEKVVSNYNVMGVAKAALEASVRYLAADLGPEGVRVNAISAGPVRTLAAAGIAGFKKMYGAFAELAPLRANISIEDVGRTALYLASDLSSGGDRRDDLRRWRASTSWACPAPTTDPRRACALSLDSGVSQSSSRTTGA